MIPKIGRGHKINDIVQIGDGLYQIKKFYDDCKDECDIQHLNICRFIACNKYDRLDDESVVYKYKREVW